MMTCNVNQIISLEIPNFFEKTKSEIMCNNEKLMSIGNAILISKIFNNLKSTKTFYCDYKSLLVTLL